MLGYAIIRLEHAGQFKEPMGCQCDIAVKKAILSLTNVLGIGERRYMVSYTDLVACIQKRCTYMGIGTRKGL